MLQKFWLAKTNRIHHTTPLLRLSSGNFIIPFQCQEKKYLSEYCKSSAQARDFSIQ
jgi:hypothetical protein